MGVFVLTVQIYTYVFNVIARLLNIVLMIIDFIHEAEMKHIDLAVWKHWVVQCIQNTYVDFHTFFMKLILINIYHKT